MPIKLTTDEAYSKFLEKRTRLNALVSADYSNYKSAKIRNIIVTCYDVEKHESGLPSKPFLMDHSNLTNPNIKKGFGCVECQKYNNANLKKMPDDIVSNLVKMWCEHNEYVFVSMNTYNNNKCFFYYKCKFGSLKKQQVLKIDKNNLYHNCGCSKCRSDYNSGKSIKLQTNSIEEYNKIIINKFIENKNQFISIIGNGYKSRVIGICKNGHKINIRADHVLNNVGCNICSGQEQKYAYIQLVLDNLTPVGVKYGIESIEGTRTISQNRQSVYDIVRIATFEFNTSEDCKATEAECKAIFQKENKKLYNRNGLVNKLYMKDGWTETTNISNTNKIIEIYKKYGAVEVNNETLEE